MTSWISALLSAGGRARLATERGLLLTFLLVRQRADRRTRRPCRRAFGVPLAGIGVALDVELEHLVQGVELSVVEEGASHGDVAQRRHAKLAAVLLVLGEVGAHRAAEPEVVKGGIGVRGERAVSRDAERVVAEVGEVGEPVLADPARVTAGAVPLLGVVEERQPALLGGAQRRPAAAGRRRSGCCTGRSPSGSAGRPPGTGAGRSIRAGRIAEHVVAERRSETSPLAGPCATFATTLSTLGLAISNGEVSGSRAWSCVVSARPSQPCPPVGPWSMLSSTASSKWCSENGGSVCR